MKRPLRFFTVLLTGVSVLACAAALAAGAALPGDSLYRLQVPLVDQNGRDFRLADRQGKLQLVSMFYTSCQYVCPLIIDTLLKTQRAVSADDNARLQMLLVSFDPGRDTTARLNEIFKQRKLDATQWTFARTDASGVRKIAAALDIRYRVLANGEVNHSSALVLLDADGRILARTDKLGEVDSAFIATLQSAVSAQPDRK
jgi:protein SCO1